MAVGTRSDPAHVLAAVSGYSNAAVTANQYLTEYLVLTACQVGGVAAYAATAGSGAGTTVVDVLKNGTSIWTTAANRPTLAAASTGEFASTAPNVSTLIGGDRLAIQVVTVPAVAGHARVSATVILERP